MHYRHALCKSTLKRNITCNIDEVTCEKCLKKTPLIPQWKIEEQISQSREQFVVSPSENIIFEEGEEVMFRNKTLAKIDKVLENGKYYLIGNAVVPYTYVSSSTPKTKSMFRDDRLPIVSYYPSTLWALVQKFNSMGFEMNPDYQREYVWDLETKTQLIDSIFNNIEIGRFLIRDLGCISEGLPSYEMVDGKQRLTAILDFMSGKFPYRGVYYTDLSASDRRRFGRTAIVMGSLDEGVTDREVKEIFIKINTHGVTMSKAHLERVRGLL